MIEAKMGTFWRTAVVAELRSLTSRIRSIMLYVPGWPGHLAGQHVALRLTAHDGYQTQRNYSIAMSHRGGERIELAVDLLSEGEVSPFLHQELKVGDRLDLRGPHGGHFVWKPQDGGPVLLIGGGSGVVPLMAMLHERALRAPETKMALLLGVRSWDDIAYRDQLLGEELGGPCVFFAQSRDAVRRPQDISGRINGAAMARAVGCLGYEPRHVFVCGSTSFVETASTTLLAAGIAAERIRTERYGGG
jgi:ferredoxin-NADP reductase